MNSNRAIVFFAWGTDWIERATACIRESRLPDYPIFVITDTVTAVSGLPPHVEVVRLAFQLSGKARKSEFFVRLPENIGTALFIDADTRVVDDISLGFEKAEKHGLAIAPAPHYSLADFRDFRRVMTAEGVTPLGQLVYNTGVIFATPHRPDVRAVFDLTLNLARKYQDEVWNEQPYLSLAMELLNFNPYTLSPSFNHRAFGELISGPIRVWHSYEPLPRDAASLEKGYLHRYEKGKLVKAVKVPL
ncbi:MAG TPA: hypothetical protein VMO75_05515 [Chthoniobacterales bacterium]|nr:hypothetical protein [Chthoniobacterales bacterium]